MNLDDFDTATDGTVLLDEVERFYGRFVAFPSEHARVAVTLAAAHAHVVNRFTTTPRIAFLSPEPESGKTRALEILELLTPNPLLALQVSPAAVFRLVEKEQPTLLLDEVDTVFSHRGKDDDNADLRGLLNSGYRKGATVPRCHGPQHEVKRFPVYAAVALAGLGDLPDTLMSRSIVVRMRRRGPDEHIDDFDYDEHHDEGHELRDRLAGWLAKATLDRPDMPDGVRDRARECWRPLIAVADAAGGDWPKRARAACKELVKVTASREASLGVKLLGDLRVIFGAADKLTTSAILERLHALEESPWGDLKGKPLSPRGLAKMLGGYGVKSTKVWVDERALQGYRREDLWDPWQRYAPSPATAEGTEGPDGGQRTTRSASREELPDDLPDAGHLPEGESQVEGEDDAVTRGLTHLPDLPANAEEGDDALPERLCQACGEPTDTNNEWVARRHIGCPETPPEPTCRVCGERLHALLVMAGETVHHWCKEDP